jgi:hypothetical protein
VKVSGKVEHRRDGVDAQAVDVILVEPEKGTADEEVDDLLAAEIEDVRAPVLVLGLLGVGVLVEMCAVEIGQTMLIAREMRWDPVEEDADAAAVEGVDEVHEFLWRAEPTRRREVADRLVAPRAVEGMLGNRQELDVRVAHVVDVVAELFRQLAIAEPAVVVFGDAHPGPEMDFVDADRRMQGVPAATSLHPLAVAPVVTGDVPHLGSSVRTDLGCEAEGIRLVDAVAMVARADGVLVERPLSDAFHPALPDTGTADGE